MNGNVTDLTIDAVRDMVRQMLWECLGNPADAEYERIKERMRSW